MPKGIQLKMYDACWKTFMGLVSLRVEYLKLPKRYCQKQWCENWSELMAFLDFPLSMRKMIYTTNPVEALHRIMRKLIKSTAAWVSETALVKQLYLSINQNEKSWKRRTHGWTAIQRDIMAIYPEIIPQEK